MGESAVKKPIKAYPRVHDEFVTMEKLHKGFSIARFGDGEFKMITGAGYVREPANRFLAKEMRSIVQNRQSRLIVGIPTMNPEGPKYASWVRHEARFLEILNHRIEYYSAFISRPDSAPWIRTFEFAMRYEDLWRGKRAVVVCEKQGSALRAVRRDAAKVVYIECPRERAYSVIDLIEKAIQEAKPEIAILSCGPTATCLAARLAKHKIQAIDFGSGGAFLASLLHRGGNGLT